MGIVALQSKLRIDAEFGCSRQGFGSDQSTGNLGCPADTDTMTVFLQQPPTVNAGTDINVCDATAAVDLSGAFNGAAGVQWTTSGTGTYAAFRAFLDSAERSLRPLDLMNLSITTSANGVHTYEMTFRLYWLR